MKGKAIPAKKKSTSVKKKSRSFFQTKTTSDNSPFFSAQPNVKVGQADNQFEKEADLMADRVVGQKSVGEGPVTGQISPMVQRKELEAETLQRQPEEEEEEMLQLQEEEEEEEMLQLQEEEEEEEMLQLQEEEEEEEMLQLQEEEEEEEMLQLQEEEEEEEMLQLQEEEEEEEMLQMQEEEEEEELQAKRSKGKKELLDMDIAAKLRQQKGKGEPLPDPTRKRMEDAFSADFSQVRIHTDNDAVQLNRALGAQAFTHGSNIYFNHGKYNPTTDKGVHLLAHELTHTIHQGEVKQKPAAKSSEAVAPQQDMLPLVDNTVNTENQQRAKKTETKPPPKPPDLNTKEQSAKEKSTSAAAPVVPEVALPTVESPSSEQSPAEAITEPLMPPPPETLNPAAQERLQQSQSHARQAATSNAEVPPAEAQTQEAREGVTEPTEETSARASGELTEALSTRPSPSPEIEELCEQIREVIRAKRPPDEDSLLQADPEEAANEAGTQLNDNIEGDVERVEGEYDELEDNPEGTPQQVGELVESPPEYVESQDLNAAGAAPDPLNEEEVSLEADVEASAQRMEEAGMNTAPAQEVHDGPIAEARETHGELEEAAAEDPALVLAQQDTALSNARADMEQLQAQAMEALQESRSQSVRGSTTQQTAMVGSEEQQRAELGRQAEAIFTNAQDQVSTLLDPLADTGMQMWETGKTRIATEFEQHLARVQSWIDDRHAGLGGAIVELWDELTGLPGWVTTEYDSAERQFGDSICELIREISTYVNGVILTCEEIIDNANREIDELFDSVPEELRAWAEEQRGQFQQRIDGLREQVSNAQQEFNQDLANRAAAAVQEVREQVHALREKAKGLLGRLADALLEFLDDPARAIINGLLNLVGIEPSAFWALIDRIGQVIEDIANDPLGFASNLLEAIGAGFQQFFDNVLSHLLEGFIEWLFAGLGAVGVQIPSDFSLSSIITFFLELMGITWERIRALLARHIGEENVALLEQAFELISDLIAMGPAGVFEMLKDQLNPLQILNDIIEMAVDFVVETLIKQATIRIIALFNPVGAIVQAVEAIYRVLSWIFENAARIFSLVETVVNGIADIIAGNIAGMATAVEEALSRLLVPVIDFIAGFMGLGDLPDRVADMIRGMQEWVEGILDRVIGWLVERARGVLEALGIGGDGGEEELDDEEVGESMSFSADEEQHRLWIDAAGSAIAVMVGSTPMTVEAKLAEWRGKMDVIEEEKQGSVQGLLNTATQQLAVVQQEGSEAKQEIQEAKQNGTTEEILEAKQADDEVETAQQSLKNTLKGLFEAFGEDEMDLSTIKGEFMTEAQEAHELFFEKEGEEFELMIASGQPKKYKNFLESIEIDSSLTEKVDAKNKLLQLQAQLETLKEGEDKEEDIQAVVQQMLVQTRLLFESGKSSIPQWGAQNTAGYGTSMVIEYLTSEAPPGLAGSSPTQAAHPYYDIINQRRKGGGSYYVRGHLLSEKLHGPGFWDNLTPLTGVANTAGHEALVENQLKNSTTQAPPQFRNKKAFRYEVKPEYGRGVNQELITKIQNSTEPIPDKQKKEAIVKGEAYVPSGLSIKATELHPHTKAPIGEVAVPSVANIIDQSGPDAYQVSKVSIAYPVKLSTASVNDLKKLFSDNIAAGIRKVLDQDKQKPLEEREITNFNILADRVPYLRLERLDKLELKKRIKL